MTVTPPEATAQRALAAAAVDRARHHVLELRDERGFWRAERFAPVGADAEDLLFREFAGIRTEEITSAVARWIKSRQEADGSWAEHERAPGDLTDSVLAYMALRLAGASPDAYHMAAAAGWIRDAGGLAAAGIRAQVWLAAFGHAEWDDLPVPPPEAVYLPQSCPVQLSGQPGWGRPTIVPLAVVGALRPVRVLPFSLDELRTTTARRQPLQPRQDPPLNGVLGRGGSERGTRHSLQTAALGAARRTALRKCGEWIIAAQLQDGSWRGTRSGWLFSLIALQLLGHSFDAPVLARGLAALDATSIWTQERAAPIRRLESSCAPVRQTALVISALADAGVPGDRAALSAAVGWLLEEEPAARSAWLAGRYELESAETAAWSGRGAPAGIEETTAVILAVRRANVLTESSNLQATLLALRWLAGVQRNDGGWGRCAAGPGTTLITRLPFLELAEIRDTSAAEPTACAVEALAVAGQPASRALRKGVAWLLRAQRPDGSWPDERGTSDLITTCRVVPALIEAGVVPSKPPVRRAVSWLLRRQNSDGGWDDGWPGWDSRRAGSGSSAPLATARALTALLAIGDPDLTAAIEGGVAFLILSQRPDGSWPESRPGSGASSMEVITAVLSALGRYLAADAQQLAKDKTLAAQLQPAASRLPTVAS